MTTTLLLDFDGTLTQKYVAGKKVPSIVSILRTENHLDDDYTRRATELAAHYHPIEIDSTIPFEERAVAMQEWWEKHFALKIEKKLCKTHLVEATRSPLLVFRKGVRDLFIRAHQEGVQIVILSAAGLGYDSIKALLGREGINFPNVTIISNEIVWDENDVMVGYKKPLLHTFNKFNFIHPESLGERVFIVGDNLADAEMLPREIPSKK
jgi:cytosolic 5'-nucleotidase 3